MPDLYDEIWGTVLEACRAEVRSLLDRAWSDQTDAADLIARWHLQRLAQGIKVVLTKGGSEDASLSEVRRDG